MVGECLALDQSSTDEAELALGGLHGWWSESRDGEKCHAMGLLFRPLNLMLTPSDLINENEWCSPILSEILRRGSRQDLKF